MAALSAAGHLPAQAAQREVGQDDPAPQVAPLDDASRSFVQEFDQLVLGDNGPVPPTALRTRLDHILAKRVAAIDRRYGLSQVQKQKLKLAGRGDIERLEDRVNRQRPKYVAAQSQRLRRSCSRRVHRSQRPALGGQIEPLWSGIALREGAEHDSVARTGPEVRATPAARRSIDGRDHPRQCSRTRDRRQSRKRRLSDRLDSPHR